MSTTKSNRLVGLIMMLAVGFAGIGPQETWTAEASD